MSKPGSCRQIVQAALKQFGSVDILVNNAAFQAKAAERFEDYSAERVRHTFAANIEALFQRRQAR